MLSKTLKAILNFGIAEDSAEKNVKRASMIGGVTNQMSGIGTASDKTANTYFSNYFLNRFMLDSIYRSSWAAEKFISIPVDDAFFLLRTMEDIEYLKAARKEFHIDDKLKLAMKVARLHGGSLLILMSTENDISEPLDIERIRPGDVTNLWIANKWDVEMDDQIGNPFDPHYGQSEFYRIRTLDGNQMVVHRSRTLRFDGLSQLTKNVVSYEKQGWGSSILYPVLGTIISEDTTARAAAQLAQEKSILIVQSQSWRMATEGFQGAGIDTNSIRMQAEEQSQMKSVYHTMYVGAGDEVARVDASISGLAEVMDMNAQRLSAAAGIPHTRFMGQAPAGLNATGESDAKNYSFLVKSVQRDMMSPAYYKLDQVLARSLGMQAPEKFSFPNFLQMDENETADYLIKLVNGGIITPEEAKTYIVSCDPKFGGE